MRRRELSCLANWTRRRWKVVTLALCLAMAFLMFMFYKRKISPVTHGVYVPPQTCTAADCTVQAPLEYSQLSPHLLLVFIYSSCGDGGRVRRDAIRSTWISMLDNSADSPIQYRFVLGGTNVPKKSLDQSVKEANSYGDMIILKDVNNDYSALADRTIEAFKYAAKHFRFSYLMKCDDDTFVDLLRVGTELENRHSHKLFYWGKFSKGRILLTGKFRESKWTVSDDYFPYALGGGYILSGDLVRLLERNEPYLMRYTSEDVTVGAWLAPYNIERKHDARFKAGIRLNQVCKDIFLVVHKTGGTEMFFYFNNLEREGVICGSNYWSSDNLCQHNYIYDWLGRPSQCCRHVSGIPCD